MNNPFSTYGNTLALAVSTTSASAALPNASLLTRGGQVVRIYNATSAPAFFRPSPTASPTAVTTDTFVAPGVVEIFSLPPNTSHVAAILTAGTGTLYIQRGLGQ